MIQFSTSLETNELNSALTKFQSNMKPIDKGKTVKMKGKSKSGNEFELKYDYAPLEHIQSESKDALTAANLSVSQDLTCFITSTGNLISGIVTRVAHASGQWKSSFWPLDLSKVGKEQDRGIAITYNKRYAYAGALNLNIGGEDTDANEVQETPKAQSVKALIPDKPKLIKTPAEVPVSNPGNVPPIPTEARKGPSEAQIKRFWAIANKSQLDDQTVHEAMETRYQVKSVTQLTWIQYSEFTKLMEIGKL